MRSTTAAVALAAILAPALALPLDSDRVLGGTGNAVNTVTSNLTPDADSGLVDAKIATGLCRALNGVTTLLNINQPLDCARIPRVARTASASQCGSGGNSGGSSTGATSTSASTTIHFSSGGSHSASTNGGQSGSVDPNGNGNGDADDATFDGSSSPIFLVSASNSVGATASLSGSASAQPSPTGTSSSNSLGLDMLLKIALGSNLNAVNGVDLRKLLASVRGILGSDDSLGLLNAVQSATSSTSTATAALSSSTDLVRGAAARLNAVLPTDGSLTALVTDLLKSDSEGSNDGNDDDNGITSALSLDTKSNALLAAALPLDLSGGNALSNAADPVGLDGATDTLSPTLTSVTGASDALLRLIVHGASGTASGALSKATDNLTGAPILHLGVNEVSKTVTGALSQATDVLPGTDVLSHPDGIIAAALHASTSTGTLTDGSLTGTDLTDGVLSGASLGSLSKTTNRLTQGDAPLIHAAVKGATGTVSRVLSQATGAVGSKSVGRPLIHGVLNGATGTVTGVVSKITGGAVSGGTRLVKSNVGQATQITAHASTATGVVKNAGSLLHLGLGNVVSDGAAPPVHAAVGQGSRVSQGSGARVDA